MKIIIETDKISEIPILKMYDAHAKALLPMVIMLHGFTSCKENNIKDAYLLAKQGYYLILFDAIRHGEREDTEFRQMPFYEKARFLVGVEMHSVKDINLILTHRNKFSPGDSERIGLIGFSMGGNAIFKYLTGEIPSCVKAAVTIVATPCWAESIRQHIADRPELEDFFSTGDFSEITAVEPAGELNNINNFPLLMLNGVQDDRVPIADIRMVYRKLQEEYEKREMVKLIEYPQLGHQVIREMNDHAVAWFNKYLGSLAEAIGSND